MPIFYKEDTTAGKKSQPSRVRLTYWKPLLSLTFFYFFIACGIERIYQPMVKYFHYIHDFQVRTPLINFHFGRAGLHIWNLWTPKVSSFRSCGNWSVLQWRIYVWSPSRNFHLKMFETTHHDYCKFNWMPRCSLSISCIRRYIINCHLCRNM